jgi:hypothetical protein
MCLGVGPYGHSPAGAGHRPEATHMDRGRPEPRAGHKAGAEPCNSQQWDAWQHQVQQDLWRCGTLAACWCIPDARCSTLGCFSKSQQLITVMMMWYIAENCIDMAKGHHSPYRSGGALGRPSCVLCSKGEGGRPRWCSLHACHLSVQRGHIQWWTSPQLRPPVCV